MRDYFLLISIFFFVAVWKGWQPGQWLLDHSTTELCRVLVKNGSLDNPCIVDGHPRRLVKLTTRYFVAPKPREKRLAPVEVTRLPLAKKVIPFQPANPELGDTELENLQKKALEQEEEEAKANESGRNKSGVEFGGFQL